MDDVVAVVAFDTAKFVKNVTSCDRKDAQKFAKYYRSIGYNARVVDYDELDEMLEKEKSYRNSFPD